MKKRFKYALVGMTIVPPLGWFNLTMMGVEIEPHVLIIPVLVGSVAGFLIGLGKDRLLNNLAQFRSILDSVPYGEIQCDEKGRILFANKTICDHLGLMEADVIGTLIWDYCSRERYRDVLCASFMALVPGKEASEPVVSSLRSATGRKVKVEIHWTSHDSTDSSPLAYTVTIVDITSQVYSQRLLQKLSQVVEHADELIMITDQYGVIEYANPSLVAKSGYSSQELIGEQASILKSPAQNPAVYDDLWETISSGKNWHGSMVDCGKDGSFYPVDMSVTPILDERGEIAAYVSVQQDQSLHQELEGQLLQSQKMEALGTLVGGIAHDFNNMLAAVKGNTYLAKKDLDDQGECDQRLLNIEGLIDQGTDMIKHLLTFARKDRVEKQDFSLNAFMVDGYRLAKTAIPENIDHITDFCQEELVVRGSATQLQQVMMNLVNNACGAVAAVESPKITCSLNRFEANEAFSSIHPALHGSSFARITVSDNGTGIKKDHIAKVFEPFFTTKDVGEGTGLGLAMVFGAISAHDGLIEVESEEGKGTSFHVYLPLSTAEVASDSVDEYAAVATSGGETILLVDDDEGLRSTTCEVLRSLDYQIIEAADGVEALRLFNSKEQEIALIITDIVMPKMGGIDLIKAIRATNQDIPVIYITGYDGGSGLVLALEQDAKKSCMIRKPFSIPALAAAIGRMLVVQ